ncbi:MAG: B12-binding domain-containing radical SAM protein [Elusimicrobia bacterium]|nr:B12-binding domain-containing radical SAM protein [Candidatus Liberimonas magnetica]
MKILLVLPPSKRLIGIQEQIFPVGLGYLAAVLEKEGYDAHIYNIDMDPNENNFELNAALNSEEHLKANYQMHKIEAELNNDSHIVWHEIFETLNIYIPDIVGISVTTMTFKAALKVAEICKKWKPDVKIVFGGHHPTIDSEMTLMNNDVDFVIRGEGEETLKELVNKINQKSDNFSEIDGLSFKLDGKIIHNRNRGLINDLNTIPYPARHLLINKNKFPDLFTKNSVMGIGRGCPWKCTFCSSSAIWGRNVRIRNISNIIGEIRMLVDKYGAQKISFYDDTFSVNKDFVSSLCERIIDEGIKIKWICLSRADCLDDKIIRLMKKAGCIAIALGVESGSDKILEFLDKKEDLEKIKAVSKLIKSNGIWLTTFFMIGIPTESKNDIEKSLNLMKEVGPNEIYLSSFKANPGTMAFEYIVNNKIMSQNELMNTNSDIYRNHKFMDNISREEYKNIFDNAYNFISEYNRNYKIQARHN